MNQSAGIRSISSPRMVYHYPLICGHEEHVTWTPDDILMAAGRYLYHWPSRQPWSDVPISIYTPVLSIFKSELNFGLNVLPEFEMLMEFNGSLNVNQNFKYCLMLKWK
jgi:hypothetical protein